MLRAYIKAIPGMTVGTQYAMADKDGVHKNARYIAKPGEEVAKLKEAEGAMRTGDLLWVADLSVLADNRDELLRILGKFCKAKYPIGIHEGRTGRVSLPPHDGQHMAVEFLARCASANKRFGVLTADEAGAIGGKKTRKRRRDEMLPEVKAKSIWLDPALYHLDTDQITEAVRIVSIRAGFKRQWSRHALYREFGPRKCPAGPKMKPGN